MQNNIKLEQFYNNSYKFLTPDYLCQENLAKIETYTQANAKSLIEFFEKFRKETDLLNHLQGMSVLDAGCGVGSMTHYFSKYADQVMGVDFSELAIIGAKKIANLKGLDLNFECHDVTKAGLDLAQTFDIIFDSHLLHCITGQENRQNYFSFIKNHLKVGGLFMAETISYNPQLQEPLGYELDDNYTLHQEIDATKIPVRTIIPSLDLEQELKESGLHINYFYYHSELSLNVFPDIKNYPEFRLPRVVRLSVTVL